MTDNYDDIINLPHPVSKTHPQMSMAQRAAQFSPFAALTGYDAAVSEEARLTDNWRQLGDDATDELNRRMALLREHLAEHPLVSVSFFTPDGRKSGGSYDSVTGHVKKLDTYENSIIMVEGQTILLSHVLDIDGEIFELREF